MIPFKPQKDLPTHEVLNMPPHLGDQDLWMSDPALRDGVAREGGSWAEEKLAKLGKIFGSAEVLPGNATGGVDRPLGELRSGDGLLGGVDGGRSGH